MRVNGASVDPPIDPATVRVVSVNRMARRVRSSSRVRARFFIRVRQAHGKWIVDENVCLWIGEAEGGDLTASVADGLTRLAAGIRAGGRRPR